MSPPVPLSNTLWSALRQIERDIGRRSSAAAVVLARFAKSPQFDRSEGAYPLDLDRALAGSFSRNARGVALTIHARLNAWIAEYGDWPDGGDAYSAHGGPVRAGWVLAVRAAGAAGYWLRAEDQRLVDGIDGLEELLEEAEDPACFPLLCELAPSWDGTAGALACAVRLGVGAPAVLADAGH